MSAPVPDAFVSSTWATVQRDLRRALDAAEREPTAESTARVRDLLIAAQDNASCVAALISMTTKGDRA